MILRKTYVVLALLGFLAFPVVFNATNAVAWGGASISGKVIAGDTGKTLARVVVHIHEENTHNKAAQVTKTDRDGHFIFKGLKPGKYFLSFLASAIQEKTKYVSEVQAVKVTLEKRQDINNVNYVITPGGGLRGTVYQSDGKTPLNGAYVSYVLPGESYSREETRVGRDGTFEFKGLQKPLELTVTARIQGRAAITKKIVIAPDKTTRVDFKMAFDKNTGVTGQVVSGLNGKPIEYARVHLKNGINHGETYTDQHGKFTIVGTRPGSYTLIATSPNGSEKVIKENTVVKTGKITEVDFKLAIVVLR